MTYNKNVKKYIKQCKYLFASYGKSEKEYISKLIDNIDDGSHDMTYDEVVERLGTPKEVKDLVHPKKLLLVTMSRKIWTA